MAKVLHEDIEAEQQKTEAMVSRQGSYGLFSNEFLQRHGLHLLRTTSTWFLLDIAFYSQNLSQKDIFSAIGWIPKAKTMNAIREVGTDRRDRARFTIQLVGFFFMTVFMFALTIPYDHWTQPEHMIGFVVMYSLTFFFANFGPNATTFAVPAEIFPARFRSTCHGISAAAGKFGAIIGAFGFQLLAQSQYPKKVDPGYRPGIGVENSLIVLGV
ncbi:hypothetical protein SASPL_107150 [Salvia splendens]|uniref:MFS transporter, PHS family, inorganic phosphate transporter n=1 Tax=Salvia splendens TaxID=180675 RepID=A0A8X8YAK7_SALSN|nr:hypothetical protein SASPL_107150 [Salvia splendens]